VVLACALDMLGRSAASLPPIELLAERPPGVDRNVEAFVRPGSGIISILATSAVFEKAVRSRCGAYDAVAKLASIIAHEEWHVRHGGDERGAYEEQLATLSRLAIHPNSGLYTGVLRSMLVVLEGRVASTARR
jgi:hypothetical protein